MKTLIKSLLEFIRKLRFKMKTLIRSKTKTWFNKQPSVLMMMRHSVRLHRKLNVELQYPFELCPRLLELTPLGTVNFLRLQLELKVRQLKTDDRVIQREGLDNLNVQELQVCHRMV